MGLTVTKVTPGTTPGGFTRSLGDTNATNAGTDAGTEGSPNTDTVIKRIFDKLGLLFEIGRGETDTDITYLKMFNADGEACYVYPNADQNDITVSATKP